MKFLLLVFTIANGKSYHYYLNKEYFILENKQEFDGREEDWKFKLNDFRNKINTTIRHNGLKNRETFDPDNIHVYTWRASVTVSIENDEFYENNKVEYVIRKLHRRPFNQSHEIFSKKTVQYKEFCKLDNLDQYVNELSHLKLLPNVYDPDETYEDFVLCTEHFSYNHRNEKSKTCSIDKIEERELNLEFLEGLLEEKRRGDAIHRV